MATSPYRVIICDLRTDQLLDVLPVTGLAFDDYIGKTGACSGTVPVTDAMVANRIRSNFIPGRTAMYVQRGKSIWWGGVLWTVTPQTDDRGFVTVGFQASTFDSYLEHRIVYDTQTFTGVDQLDIVRDLVDYAQTATGGDIGIQCDSLVSGVERDRTYLSYDLLNIREQIDLLSNVEDGFEWRVRAYSDSDGSRVRNLQLGYPKIKVGSTDLVLTSPGKIISYSLPTDGTTIANFWQSRGASINDDASEETYPLMSDKFFWPQDLDAGWPRLDGSSDYSTVSDWNTLRHHALADIARYRRAIIIPEVEVLLGDNITPALLGTTTRIRIKDLWFNEGVSLRYRIVGIKVTPSERGKPETASLYLELI